MVFQKWIRSYADSQPASTWSLCHTNTNLVRVVIDRRRIVFTQGFTNRKHEFSSLRKKKVAASWALAQSLQCESCSVLLVFLQLDFLSDSAARTARRALFLCDSGNEVQNMSNRKAWKSLNKAWTPKISSCSLSHAVPHGFAETWLRSVLREALEAHCRIDGLEESFEARSWELMSWRLWWRDVESDFYQFHLYDAYRYNE